MRSVAGLAQQLPTPTHQTLACMATKLPHQANMTTLSAQQLSNDTATCPPEPGNECASTTYTLRFDYRPSVAMCSPAPPRHNQAFDSIRHISNGRLIQVYPQNLFAAGHNTLKKTSPLPENCALKLIFSFVLWHHFCGHFWGPFLGPRFC